MRAPSAPSSRPRSEIGQTESVCCHSVSHGMMGGVEFAFRLRATVRPSGSSLKNNTRCTEPDPATNHQTRPRFEEARFFCMSGL